MKLNIKDKLKRNQGKYRRRLCLLGASGLILIGGFIAYLGNSEGNVLVITLGFAGLAGGFLLLRSWRHMGETRILKKTGPDGKEKIEEKSLNSLILYPDWIDFAYVEKPAGQSQKNYNDGLFYYVLTCLKPYFESDKAPLSELRLPDDDENERCYEPLEFSNVVTMPSNKKYFTWSASTMQKVSIGIMALVIAGELIGLIALT